MSDEQEVPAVAEVAEEVAQTEGVPEATVAEETPAEVVEEVAAETTGEAV